MKNKVKLVTIYVFVVCVIFACKKEKISTNVEETVGDFNFHIHSYLGEKEFDEYGFIDSIHGTRKISIEMAQCYISEIQLVKLDGSFIPVTTKGILKTTEEESYSIGNVPVGNYKGIRFKIGLNSMLDATSPLAVLDSNLLNKPTMWYSSTPQMDGYIYFNFQGKIDTSSSKTGSLIPFQYKFGTQDNFLQIQNLDKTFTIMKGEKNYFHFNIHYDKFFENIDLTNIQNLKVGKNIYPTNEALSIFRKNIASMIEVTHQH